MSERRSRLPRRSFLATAGASAAAVGAVMSASPAFAQSAPAGERFQPARHGEDAWLDQLGGKHRLFLDTITADALGQALAFTNNFYTANKSGYGLESSDLAVVICMRHQSTGFAFTDAMWAKYGKGLSERASFTDPKTKLPPVVNIYRVSDYGPPLRNNGITLDATIKNGAHFAVCQMATRAIAAATARLYGGNADEIYQELVANRIANSHMVPAGIVAVSRAQEYGYTFGYVT